MGEHNMAELTLRTIQVINKLFSEPEADIAKSLLAEKCSDFSERILFAILKLSSENFDEVMQKYNSSRRFWRLPRTEIDWRNIKCSGGSINELKSAIEIALCDWRDVLVYAGFGSRALYSNVWADRVIGMPSEER
jgi:hypothetical protein